MMSHFIWESNRASPHQVGGFNVRIARTSGPDSETDSSQAFSGLIRVIMLKAVKNGRGKINLLKARVLKVA
jgi:hypothetical protein